MKTAWILLGLLVVSMATNQVDQLSDDDNAADVLVDQVSKIQADIVDEQQRHDALHEAQDAEGVQEVGFRNSEITDGSNALAASQAALSRLENAQAASNTDLSRAQGYDATVQEILGNLANQRAADAAAYDTLVNAELIPAIQAVQGVYPILAEYQEQVSSFVQVSSHLNKIFTHMVKVNRTSQFGAILAVLLQQNPNFEGGLNGDVIEQLETLFDNLEEDLTDAKSAAIDKENAAIAVYNETVDEYNAIRATLAATISNLEDYLQVLEDGIDTENSVSASASAKVARNTDALQHALDMLAAFDTEYTNSTQARNDELALLNKLKNFINEQADIFGDFGNDGVDAYQQYQNSFAEKRAASRANFLQATLKKFNKNSALKTASNLAAKCVSCRNSFLQKKLGF